MSTQTTLPKDQAETILYTPIPDTPVQITPAQMPANVSWINPNAANDKTQPINSGIFAFASDDPDFVDENGHVSLARVFNYNAATGAKLTPEQRKKHLEKGLIKDWDRINKILPSQVTHILHASGSTIKVEELRQSVQHYAATPKLIGGVLGYTVEDSKETQDNGAEITADKITISIDNELKKLTPSEINEIKTSLDVNNFDNILSLSDDRSVLLDPVLRQSSVWDDIRNSDIPEVKEAFQSYHDFPGKRMKEVMKACGGAINFADRLQAAHAELNAKGIQTNRDVSFGVWVFAKATSSETGVYLYQQMNGAEFIPVTHDDRRAAQEGKTFDVDHFVVSALHKGILNKEGKPYTLANLRAEKDNFYAEEHPITHITHKLMKMTQVATLDTPQNWDPIRITNPKATAAGGSISHIKKTRSYIKGQRPLRKSTLHHLGPEHSVTSILDIEKTSFKSDALVIPPQDYSRMSTENALALKLKRRLVVDHHLALYHAGSYVGSGCPLVIAQDALNEHKHHASFYNSGASATHLMDAVKLYDGTAASLDRTLNSNIWDKELYKPHNKRKKLAYDFMTEEELCDTIGISDIAELGPTIAVLGGATTELPSAIKQTEDMAYEAAKQGVTLLHGGGSRGVMGAIMKGAMRAYNEGYRGFKQIAIRTPIVSAAEGSMAQFLEKNDLDVTNGDINSDYYSFMDDHIHVIEKPAFGVRQDAILRFAQGAIVLPGGHGTAYEDDHININNLNIMIHGHGVFPGNGAKNNRIIDKHIVNIDGHFDEYIETFTTKEQALLHQTISDNATASLNAIVAKIQWDLALEQQQRMQSASIHTFAPR